MATRTVTDQEVALKAELAEMIASGASADEIVAKANAIAQHIIEAAEAEGSLQLQGHTWTQEQRDALSAKLKGRPGKPWTDEQREKQKASWTPEKRAALSEKLTGRHLTDEQKAKLSNSLRMGSEAKKAAQEAQAQRIRDLEAQLAGLGSPVAETVYADPTAIEAQPDAEPEIEGKQRGRRR